jgi:hypothetical protein
MNLDYKDILTLTLEGDFIENQFMIFAVHLKYNEHSFTIFLDSEQTQFGLDFDDEFESILSFTNLLSDSGIEYCQFISVINNDESSENIVSGFMNDYNGVSFEPWGQMDKITILNTAPDDASGGNIQLSSTMGNVFEINTESYLENTSQVIKNISNLLLQTGVDVIVVNE